MDNQKENWSVNSVSEFNRKFSCNDKRWNFGHIAIVLSIISLFFMNYMWVLIVLNTMSFVYFLYKFILSLLGPLKKSDQETWKNLNWEELPSYCVLLPMRNEKPYVVQELIQNINDLNYPKDRLDVIMLIDEDDEYLAEIKDKLWLPDHFRIISASAKFPFTKPKVCNLGLAHTEAQYVTIYDVEDNPDPNQLLKVVAEFWKDKKLSCVQCSLNYENEKNNILTRFFTNEYLTWFNLTIKGLDYSQRGNKVIPLGGTSQHLKVEELIEIGGWDAFNVTEDCDLGIRMARLGKKTITIDSVTIEKAVENLSVWFKQRNRWQKGFIVTFFTHSKNPLKTIKDLGIYGYMHFIFAILGNIAAPLITPILFFLFVDSLFFDRHQSGFVEVIQWVTLIGNYLLIVISHLYATVKYRKGKFALWTLLQPFYYLLQSVSVYWALYEYFTKPFHWRKTEHK